MSFLLKTGYVTLPTSLASSYMYSKTCLKRSLKMKTKIGFRADYRLMQVKSIAECSNAIKTFVLSIFEWPLKTGFAVCQTRSPCPIQFTCPRTNM